MQSKILSRMTMAAALAIPLTLLASARAQDDSEGPPPEGEAVSAHSFEAAQVDVDADEGGADDRPRHRKWVIPGGGVYYSPNLRGHFRGEWLYIMQRGRRVSFWGARIVHLDGGSPLRQVGLSPGDVITRLDGVPIARGMFREGAGPWQIVQMEEHFGRTEVRYIIRGSDQVAVGDMMLDGVSPDGFVDPNPIPP